MFYCSQKLLGMTSFTLLKIDLLHNVHSILETLAQNTKGHGILFLTSYTRKVKKKQKNKLFVIYAFLMLALKGIKKINNDIKPRMGIFK